MAFEVFGDWPMQWRVTIALAALALAVFAYTELKTPQVPPGKPATIGGNWDIEVTKAIAGHRIIIKGTKMKFSSLRCPNPDTIKGRDAKALMNTFLRAGYVYCTMRSYAGSGWVGNCTVNGKDVSAGMKKSGLCR